MQRIWFKIAVFNFFIAASIGALLRFAFIDGISWLKFQNWLHGHSHVAMLGWIYLALFALLIHTILPKEKQNSKIYKWLFGLTQLSVVGMLIAFPLQGYAGWSIAFSTIHVLLSYVFVWQIWKDISQSNTAKNSVLFIRAALLFLLLSSITVGAMPILMLTGKAGSALYYGAVQFYLHFQFNGWFIFAVLGLFFKLLENKNILYPPKLAKVFFNLLVISCFLTFALAVTWSTPLPFLFLINSLGVIIQMAALIVFILIIKKITPEIKAILPKWVGYLMTISFLSFTLKILMQTAVVIPYIATVAYTIRNYAIGFLHLMLLGMITCFLIGFGGNQGFLKLNSRWAKTGIVLFIIGFILSESILFLQGTMLWGAMGFLPLYYELLFGLSVIMPVGIGILLIGQINSKKNFGVEL